MRIERIVHIVYAHSLFPITPNTHMSVLSVPTPYLDHIKVPSIHVSVRKSALSLMLSSVDSTNPMGKDLLQSCLNKTMVGCIIERHQKKTNTQTDKQSTRVKNPTLLNFTVDNLTQECNNS